MKRIIHFLFIFGLLPCVVVIVASMFYEEIRLGVSHRDFKQYNSGIQILIEQNGLCKNMDLEQYVYGVLVGVIPASYDEEAIKAQAVLVRTNILREMEKNKSTDASLLSYHYLPLEERNALFGERYSSKYEKKFMDAVMGTAGQVLVQNGKYIMAMYHEVSMGKTASANEILDEEISYLQSVDSPQDVEAKNYVSEKSFTWKEINCLLGREQDGSKSVPMQILESSQNGYVKRVKIGEQEMQGKDLMQLLGLASTNYYMESTKMGYHFVCLGRGTGMGLSIYGSNCLAQNGNTYKDILGYYYKNVSLVNCKSLKKEERNESTTAKTDSVGG